MLGGETDAGIGHFEADAQRIDARRQQAGAEDDIAVLGELDGIGREIGQQLRQAHAVAMEHRRNVGIDPVDDFEPFVLSLQTNQIVDLAEYLVEFEIGRVKGQLVSLDF